MTEKPLENQPHIENQPLPNEGADFLEFQQWKAKQEHEKREKDRNHFSRPADDTNAEKVEAKILKFEPKVPAEVETESAGLDPIEMEKINSDPEQWLKDTISKPQKVMDDPYAAVEGMAKAQEVSQQKKEAA